MPNTRADLDRLKHHWEQGTCAWDDTDADEILAMAERLLTERNNLRAELIERCETIARMAREPLWLTVSSGNPMIHFVSDPQWIWSGIAVPPPQLTCIRCGQTFPEHELSAHLATCE